MSSGLFPDKLLPKPLQTSLPELDHNWRTKSKTTSHCSSQFLDNTASVKHISLAPQKTPCQRTELDLQKVKNIGVERRCLECCQQGAHNRCLEHKHLETLGSLTTEKRSIESKGGLRSLAACTTFRYPAARSTLEKQRRSFVGRDLDPMSP